MNITQHTAVRFRAYPTREQAAMIDRTIGCTRFVYNLMLETRIAHYQTTWESCNPTPAMYKDAYPFLRDVDSMALCNAQLALQKAYRNFFDHKRAGFPKYKSKHHAKAAYTTNSINNSIRLSDNARRLRLPKLGWVTVRQHKHIPADWKLKSATVEHTRSDRYIVTVLFEHESQMPDPTPPARIIGLDYASHGLYVSSEGEHAQYPGYYRDMEPRLAREQRRLAHMVKGSANWRKQRIRVARLFEKTANRRRDFQHKTANKLVANCDAIAVETLNLQGMTRKPKPKTDPHDPNRYLPNGRTAKSGLAKSTLDNGYGMFCDLLRYKLDHAGKRLIRVDAWYPSSQLCHACGYRNREVKDLSIREWVCPQCGTLHDRDVNAALNIRNEAERMLSERHDP